MTTCHPCVDKGLAATMGSRDETSTAPFECQMRAPWIPPNIARPLSTSRSIDVIRFFAREDIFDVCLWMAGIRRASTRELRSALLRVKKLRPRANLPGLEDALGLEGEVPTEGTSLPLMAAQSRGTGSRAGKVAYD